MYLFIFACTESALLCTGFLELRQAGNALLIVVGGLLLLWSTVSRARGLSSWSAWPELPLVMWNPSGQTLNLCPLHWQIDS